MTDTSQKPYETEMEEGYLLAIEESITTIFQKLLNLDQMKYVYKRIGNWLDYHERYLNGK